MKPDRTSAPRAVQQSYAKARGGDKAQAGRVSRRGKGRESPATEAPGLRQKMCGPLKLVTIVDRKGDDDNLKSCVGQRPRTSHVKLSSKRPNIGREVAGFGTGKRHVGHLRVRVEQEERQFVGVETGRPGRLPRTGVPRPSFDAGQERPHDTKRTTAARTARHGWRPPRRSAMRRQATTRADTQVESGRQGGTAACMNECHHGLLPLV